MIIGEVMHTTTDTTGTCITNERRLTRHQALDCSLPCVTVTPRIIIDRFLGVHLHVFFACAARVQRRDSVYYSLMFGRDPQRLFGMGFVIDVRAKTPRPSSVLPSQLMGVWDWLILLVKLRSRFRSHIWSFTNQANEELQ